jgi:TonB family protein
VSEFRNRELAARHPFALPARIAFCVITTFAVLPARTQTAAPANAAEDPELKAMKDLAGNVAQSVKKSNLKNLVVMDFSGPNKTYFLMGRKLADDLSAALAADPAISLVARTQYTDFEYREALLIPEANQPDRANWVASQLSAKSFVIGNYEENGTDFVLHLTIYDCPKPRIVQELKATIPKTDEISALARSPLTATGDDLRNENKKRSSMPHYGTRGYSPPECRYCPQPEFSTEARRLKAGGIATLIAEVDETGQITDAVIIQGLFYGLNEKAVEGVKRWRMKPAIGQDGSPVAVQQVIEVSFRLY